MIKTNHAEEKDAKNEMSFEYGVVKRFITFAFRMPLKLFTIIASVVCYFYMFPLRYRNILETLERVNQALKYLNIAQVKLDGYSFS